MKRPDKNARKAYMDIVSDTPSFVRIPGTKKDVRLTGVHPYTMECLTNLWLERDLAVPESSSDTLKSVCIDPYFAVREALYFVLNSWWKITLFHRFLSFWWGKVKGYTDEQMLPIIQEGKKKVQLTAHWAVMAYSTDMRTDWMKMTSKEAEQFQAELLSAAKQLSSKSSPATEGQDTSFSA